MENGSTKVLIAANTKNMSVPSLSIIKTTIKEKYRDGMTNLYSSRATL